MTSNRATNSNRQMPAVNKLANSYYALLGVHPSASVIEIRRAYRELSKRYHPDTTDLAPKIATEKFHQLNQAYATLSNPEQRRVYDHFIGYSRVYVVQPSPAYRLTDNGQQKMSSEVYLDPTDRPLSAGEIFALFILALTFIGCLMLAIAVAFTRPEDAFAPIELPSSILINSIV